MAIHTRDAQRDMGRCEEGGCLETFHTVQSWEV